MTCTTLSQSLDQAIPLLLMITTDTNVIVELDHHHKIINEQTVEYIYTHTMESKNKDKRIIIDKS